MTVPITVPANTLPRGRVLVVARNTSFLERARRLLRTGGYTVGWSDGYAGVPEALSRGGYHLVVIDPGLGTDAYASILESARERATPALVVTEQPTMESAIGALRARALDYLIAPVNDETLLERVRLGVSHGKALGRVRMAREHASSVVQMCEDVADVLQSAMDMPGAHGLDGSDPLRNVETQLRARLSPREEEVLRVFASFPRATEVATRLDISLHTVRNHLKSIFRKLGVSSQVELLRLLTSG